MQNNSLRITSDQSQNNVAPAIAKSEKYQVKEKNNSSINKVFEYEVASLSQPRIITKERTVKATPEKRKLGSLLTKSPMNRKRNMTTNIPESFLPQSSRSITPRKSGTKSVLHHSKDSRTGEQEGLVSTERYIDSKGEVYIEMTSQEGSRVRKKKVKLNDINKIEKRRKFLKELSADGIDGFKKRLKSPIDTGESKFIKKFIPKID